MLVPLVLRSIVLPYLRTSTTHAAAASSSTAPRLAAASISSSARTSRAAEAELSQEGGLEHTPFQPAWEPPAELRHHARTRRPPPTTTHLPLAAYPGQQHCVGPPHTKGKPPPRPKPPREEDAKTKTKLSKTKPGSESSPDPHLALDPSPPSPSPLQPTPSQDTAVQRVPVIHKPVDIFDRTPNVPEYVLPPNIDMMIKAKLYRLAVYTILSTVEYSIDESLVQEVARKLRNRGAGALAIRLQRSVKQPFRPNGKPHILLPLCTEAELAAGVETAAPAPPKPAGYWRLPLVPFKPDEVRGLTPVERRTRFYNSEISRHMTVQHPIPRSSPILRMGQPKPKLRKVRDMLTYIDTLRRNHKFIPDRVTANIVLKAWLMQVSRGKTWRDEHGARKQDLRNIFDIVATSIETETPIHIPNPDPGPVPDFDFITAVDYHRHVVPFGRLVMEAMVRAGDREGRQVVKVWMDKMRDQCEAKEKAAAAASAAASAAAANAAVEAKTKTKVKAGEEAKEVGKEEEGEGEGEDEDVAGQA